MDAADIFFSLAGFFLMLLTGALFVSGIVEMQEHKDRQMDMDRRWGEIVKWTKECEERINKNPRK